MAPEDNPDLVEPEDLGLSVGEEKNEAKLHRLRNLTQSDRDLAIWDSRVKGIPLVSISRAFNITKEEVSSALQRAGAMYREEILNLPAVDIIASNVHWLDEMERVALFEAHQLEPQVIKVRDEVTGQLKEERIIDPNRAKFFGSAIDARKTKIKLMMDTGIIPSNSPESLFKKLSDFDASSGEEEVEERSEEEILESISRLIQHGRYMQPKDPNANRIPRETKQTPSEGSPSNGETSRDSG